MVIGMCGHFYVCKNLCLYEVVDFFHTVLLPQCVACRMKKKILSYMDSVSVL